MRLRFTTSIAGMHYSFRPGDETDWPNDAEARRLVEAGFAVPVRSVQIETADAPPAPESADAPPSGGKKSGSKKSG